MPRIKGEPKVRLNLDVTEKVRDRMMRLKSATEAESLSEVVRRALAVYEVLCVHRESGGAVILELVDGRKERLQIV